eukprot:5799827-Pleurochrysis_carterae.AAC.1
MPVRAPAVPALHVVAVPRSARGLALFVACVTTGVSALRSCVRRRGRFVVFRLASLFRNESSALRLVEFDIAADLACLKVAQDLSDGGERERQVARCALHYEFWY